MDKPPLTLYPIAASIGLFGRHEWAVRLPTLLWGALLLWMVARIARRLGRDGESALALALLSPLLWSLVASAFTDVAMVALVLTALERALAGRPAQAGLLFGLALLAKPTALLLLPLLLLAGPLALDPFLLALAAPLLLGWAWDASRDAISWWALGAQAYGTLGNPTGQVGAWLRLAAGALGLPALAALGMARARRSWLLATMLLLWIPLHLLLGFQPWERYLLPLVPLAALWLAPTEPPRWRPLLWAALLLVPLAIAPLGIEPRDGAWEGMAALGVAIERLPAGSVVYYRQLGRPLAWYAADSRATLRWGGREWERLPPLEHGSFLAVRSGEPLPAAARGWRPVARAGHFALLAPDPLSLEP